MSSKFGAPFEVCSGSSWTVLLCAWLFPFLGDKGIFSIFFNSQYSSIVSLPVARVVN